MLPGRVGAGRPPDGWLRFLMQDSFMAWQASCAAARPSGHRACPCLAQSKCPPKKFVKSQEFPELDWACASRAGREGGSRFSPCWRGNAPQRGGVWQARLRFAPRFSASAVWAYLNSPAATPNVPRVRGAVDTCRRKTTSGRISRFLPGGQRQRTQGIRTVAHDCLGPIAAVAVNPPTRGLDNSTKSRPRCAESGLYSFLPSRRLSNHRW